MTTRGMPMWRAVIVLFLVGLLVAVALSVTDVGGGVSSWRWEFEDPGCAEVSQLCYTGGFRGGCMADRGAWLMAIYEQKPTRDLIVVAYSREAMPVSTAAHSSWSALERYLSAARQQILRIESLVQQSNNHNRQNLLSTRANPDGVQPNFPDLDEYFQVSRELSDQLRAEIHFYFTCWAMIGRSVHTLAKYVMIPGLEAIAIREGLDKDLKFGKATPGCTLAWYGRMRNNFDHQDERTPERDTYNHTRVETTEPGIGPMISADAGVVYHSAFNIINNSQIEVGGNLWDFSRTSLEKLEDICAEVGSVVRDDCFQRIRTGS